MNFSRTKIFTRSNVESIELCETDLEKKLIYNTLVDQYDKLKSLPTNHVFEALVTRNRTITSLNIHTILSDIASEQYDHYLEENFGTLKNGIEQHAKDEFLEIIHQHIEAGDFDNYIENPFEGSQHVDFEWTHRPEGENKIRTPRMNEIIETLGSTIYNFYAKGEKEPLLEQIERFHQEVIALQSESEKLDLNPKSLVKSINMESYISEALLKDENTRLLAKLQETLETAIKEDTDVQRLKELVDQASGLFEDYYDVEINDYDLCPDDSMIEEIATDMGMDTDRIDTETIQEHILESSIDFIKERIGDDGYDANDIQFDEGYSGYYNLRPKMELFTDEYSPKEFNISIYDFSVTEMTNEGPEAILNMIQRLENEGLDALCDYHNIGNSDIEFSVGENEYENPTDAIDDVETWIEQMEAIACYMDYYKDETDEEAMKDKVRSELEE